VTGPLQGVRIIEIAGIGPGPFAAMMLADHGAEVIRVDRPGGVQAGVGSDASKDVLARSRRNIAVDLKSPEGAAVVRDLVATADGLIEGFRPGVMERLGLGPDALLARNPKLVYGRMTGWGQTGPYAASAGHDINYIALSGALHAIGRTGERPPPPLNLIGDFGGGGMMLAFGIVSAILHARRTGEGQVIDCGMTDGAALLTGIIWGLRAQGRWNDERGANLLDGGAHFYDTYETADGGFVSIGPIEPQFYALLREKLGLADDPAFDRHMDPTRWSALQERLTAVFRTKTRAEWCELLEHTDTCFAPVLSFDEAAAHPHNVARGTFIEVDGVKQPAPAPRYSRTETDTPAMTGGTFVSDTVLTELGYDAARIAALQAQGAIT